MLLYLLGGLGPALAGIFAVRSTCSQPSLAEFRRRCLRWRISPAWYAVAAGLPVALAPAAIGLARLLGLDTGETLSLRPWWAYFPLLVAMVAGGGIEEPGWRGVAQPEAERRLGRPLAALLVGLIWACWHLPLFYIPGVGQYRSNFPVFALGIIGNALILAWLYGRTKSVLLCVLFHASWNAIVALGWTVPSDRPMAGALADCVRVAAGAILLATD